MNLPFIQLELGGETFVATPLNTHLYTFAGQTVLAGGEVIENETRNHVYLQTKEQQDGVMKGTYIFAPDTVDQLGAALVEHGFPCSLNKREIPNCDEEAYQKYVSQLVAAEVLPDEIPDWLTEGEPDGA